MPADEDNAFRGKLGRAVGTLIVACLIGAGLWYLIIGAVLWISTGDWPWPF